ncbi:MAG: hypothetical protein ACKOC5_13650 [Chloroflexota bacterium]
MGAAEVAVTLRNANNNRHTLSLTDQAWYALLDLAEAYGWRPLGALPDVGWAWLELDLPGYDPTGMVGLTARSGRRSSPAGDGAAEEDGHPNSRHANSAGRLVILEDALSLADALDEAFMDYEPARVPASFYLFEPEDPALRDRPAIGAIQAAVAFCRLGAFYIDAYRRGAQP